MIWFLMHITPEDHLDCSGKGEEADLESDQGSGDDIERQVTSLRIKERVATEITKGKNRQRKYHTKKSAQRGKEGRVKGSKAKNSIKQQVANVGWF